MANTSFSSNLGKILSIIDNGARDSVNETVDAIADDAARDAPRDKGALATSVVALRDGDDHGAAVSAAENRASGIRSDIEFDTSLELGGYGEEGVHIGAVEVPVSYAPLIHNGFGDRAGRPFLEQAGNAREPDLQRNMSQNIAGKLD